MTAPGGGYNLGSVRGSISINVAQAVAAYAAVRRQNAATNTALLEGGRAFTRVGLGLAGVGAAALAGFGVAVKAAADFQKELSYFGAVTDSSKADMEALRKKALQLGRDSAYGAAEVVNSFVELGKAGLTAKDIIAGVGDAVVTLAAAGDVPLQEASDTIVNAMKTYQIAAKDSVKIADMLAGAANASTVDIRDLAYGLKYVGGTAASLNISLGDTLNALGQLGNAGIRGSTGGTALRKILLSLSPVSKKAAAELEALGIIQTNGGVSASKYAKAQDKQKTAIDNLRKAQQRLLDVQALQAARADSSSKSSSGSSAKAAEAAARRQQAAVDRLAAAQQHLQTVEQKYASTPLASTAAKQASRFAALASAQQRVANAQQHLNEVQAKNAAGSGSSSSSSSSSSIRSAIALRNAQEAVAAAADKVRASGIPLAKGIEKQTNLFFDATGKAKPLAQIFQILQDHMKGMTQQQKVQAAETIFGNRAISSALILTREGAKGFADFQKQMSQVTALEVMHKRLDNLSGAWKIFKSSVQTALIEVGTPALKPLTTFVRFLTSIVNAFARLPGPVQQAMAGFVVFFGALTLGAGSLILIVGFAAKAVRAFRELKAAMMFVKELQLLARAWAILDVVMDANPIVLIILAVIALVAGFILLYKHSETFRKVIQAIGRVFEGAFRATINWFTKTVPAFFSRAWKDIGKAFEVGVGWVKKNWDLLLPIFFGPLGLVILIWRRFGGTLKKVAGEVVKDVVNFFEKLPGRIGSALSTGFTAVLRFLAALPDKVAYGLGFIIGRLLRFDLDVVKLAYRIGKDIVMGIVHFFEALPGETERFFTRTGTAIKNTTVQWWHDATHFVSNMYDDVVGFFRRLPGEIAHWLTVFKDREIEGWKTIYSTAKRWAGDAYNAVINFFKNLPGDIKDFMVNAWHSISNTAKDAYNAANDWAAGVQKSIGQFFTDLPGKVLQALKDAVSNIKTMGKDAFNAMKDWGTSLWNGFKKGLFGSPRTKVEYALEDMTATGDREVKKLQKQVLQIQALGNKLPAAGSSSGAYLLGAQRTPQVAGNSTVMHRTTEVTINNPTPERSSESLPRVLRAIEFVGA